MSAAAPAVREPGEHLLGRHREREALDRLLRGAHDGSGGVLALHGEPGVGKTALLDYAVEASPEFRVARTTGVEGEMELPFAALQNLCSPFLGLTQGLPQPQRDALAVAFGLSAGPSPNPFLVGLAVLGLLSDTAEAAAGPRRHRRRAVARSCLGARARLRGSAPVGRADRADLRDARPRRNDGGIAGARDRAAGASRRASALGVRAARPPGRRGAGAHRRRDARESARAHRAATRLDAGAARRRLRPARDGAVVGQHRRKLHAPARNASARRAAPVARRRGRPGRRSRARLGRGATAGDSRDRRGDSSKRRAC